MWAGLVISILPSIPFPFPTDFIRTVFNHFNQCHGCLPVSPSVRGFTTGWSGFFSRGSGFHLEAGCQYWKLLVVLRHPTNTPHCDSVVVFGGWGERYFLLIYTLSSCELWLLFITAVEFRFLFPLFHCRVKRQITSFHLLHFAIFLFFSITWSKSDRPHFICYTWNYVGLDL